MRTVELNGTLYTEQACVGESTCAGCAGDNKEEGGEGICGRLPTGCSIGGGIIWVRSVPKSPTYEGVAESLAKQFDQPVPQATIIIDETELRDLWKRAYIAGIRQDVFSPFNVGQYAVDDYKRARAEGIV